jgi:hypothetical protein
LQGNIKDSYLIKLLKTFSHEEIRSFGKFVASPYYNTGHKVGSAQLIKLYEILLSFYPEFISPNLAKHVIYGELFYSERYDDRQMRILTSVFTRLAEKFISVHHSDPFENKRVLMETLSLRGLDNAFNKHYSKMMKVIDRQRMLQENYYRSHVMNILDVTFATYRQKEIRYSRLTAGFVKYFTLQILDIYIKLAIDSRIRNRKYDYILLEEVTGLIKSSPGLFADEPLIMLYFHELMLALNENEESYYMLVEYKNKMINDLDPIELFNVYILMGNFCIFMQDKGHKSFYGEKFRLDKEFVARNVFGIVQFIQYQVFIAVFVNAVSVNEHAWALEFIRGNEARLDPAAKKHTLSYCMAEYHFSMGNYSEALGQLSKVNFEFSQLKQLEKNLKLKMYFESEAFESAYSLLDASKKQLAHEKEMSPKIKELHLRFLKYYEILLKTLSSGMDLNNPAASDLRNRIQKEENFSNKQWLLSKLG